jgi:proton-dependent oligopeptide transporter, POT family
VNTSEARTSGPVNTPHVSAKKPFPRTFYAANAIELFERWAFYGMFVSVSIYLGEVIGFSDAAVGSLLGWFRLVTSLAPVPCGALADRIRFKRSLIIAFFLYSLSYLALFASPSKRLAALALMGVAISGGFMKPVITGTVVRTAPEGREADGFGVYYRMINAGSVVGKTISRNVRTHVGLRFVSLNSVAASLVALAIAIFVYKEPERGQGTPQPFGVTLRGYGAALKNGRFSLFLIIFAGFYFMSDQFYFTFPQYVTRHIRKDAPLEYVTLVNPLTIALFQGVVTRMFARFTPITSMIFGMLIASLSMFVMGVAPGLAGACLSGAIFAIAEMTFAPRFYAYIASFAPEGKAGMYMGLAFVPQAVGGWLGGQASGTLVGRYLPVVGPRNPFVVWSIYACLGVVCALAMMVYRKVYIQGEARHAAA